MPVAEAPRPVLVALEELEYHDAGFRESAAARLIELGPDARPFVEEALRRAKTSGKEILAAQCQRILDGMEAYRSFRVFVTNELSPEDKLRVYPDPPRVRFDFAPELFVEGTFLFGIQGRLRPLGSLGPPPSIVRIFAVGGRTGNQFELKGWKGLATVLRPAVGDQEIRDTSLLVIKLCASQACSCIDPADVRVDNLAILPAPSGSEVRANAMVPDPMERGSGLGEWRRAYPFEITFGSDGRISSVRYSVKPHHHM